MSQIEIERLCLVSCHKCSLLWPTLVSIEHEANVHTEDKATECSRGADCDQASKTR